MPVVKDLVDHILHHVVAEDAERDPSQVAGVGERAQFARDTLVSLAQDDSDRPLGDIVSDIALAAPGGPLRASFRRAIANMVASGERTPWLATMEWVARRWETQFVEES